MSVINSPYGWEPGPPVYSAEGCWYPTWRRTQEGNAMSRDELKAEIQDGIDRILSHPFFTNQKQKALLHGQQAAYVQGGSVVDAWLDLVLQHINGGG